jgi:hypothetical protein
VIDLVRLLSDRAMASRLAGVLLVGVWERFRSRGIAPGSFIALPALL